MLDNVNKMPPDPQFEKLGWQGWRYFKEKLYSIYRDYKEYGDIVLEKKLGESIEIYRAAFESKIFENAIYEIWKERYHYVADTLDDIILFYEKYDKNGFFKNNYLLTEKSEAGSEATFSLSEELYEYIVHEALKDYEKQILVLKEGKLYKITLGPKEYKYNIKMGEVKVIKLA